MENNSTEVDKPVQKLMGERVKQRRVALGLKQQQLAERMQVEGFNYLQSTVTKVEAGVRPSGPDEIAALGRVLSMTPSELLGSEAAPVSEEIAEAVEYLRSTGAQLLASRREIRDLTTLSQIQQVSLDSRIAHAKGLLAGLDGAAAARLSAAIEAAEAISSGNRS